MEDGGDKRDMALVMVYVSAVGDGPPRFPYEMYHTGVLENFFFPAAAAPGATVMRLIQVRADAPNELTYTMKSGDQTVFEVDPRDGWLSLRRPVDREVRDIYQVEIEARYAGMSFRKKNYELGGGG